MSLSHTTPLIEYNRQVEAGVLRHDPIQHHAAETLTQLRDALTNYKPQDGQSGWRAKLFGLTKERQKTPQGLYLVGRPGRGKSMLMDLFFNTLETAYKRRVHFHEFMLEVLDRLHVLRQKSTEEPLKIIAADIAQQVHVLCFDEFVVNDITYAMILKEFFTCLIESGVVVVATSNFKPEELYKDGLQRENFIPFINYLRQHLDVLVLDSETDYRKATKDYPHYLYPANKEHQEQLNSLYLSLTNGEEGEDDSITVKGRAVYIPRACNDVAWFEFAKLCAVNLGVIDYLALSKNYQYIFINNIPRFTASNRDEAKRFMLLIDVLYEAKTKLACTAAVAINHLCNDNLLSFEFSRTLSRLNQMQDWSH